MSDSTVTRRISGRTKCSLLGDHLDHDDSVDGDFSARPPPPLPPQFPFFYISLSVIRCCIIYIASIRILIIINAKALLLPKWSPGFTPTQATGSRPPPHISSILWPCTSVMPVACISSILSLLSLSCMSLLILNFYDFSLLSACHFSSCPVLLPEVFVLLFNIKISFWKESYCFGSGCICLAFLHL